MSQRPASQAASPSTTQLPHGAVVTYRFQDSSVPPPYHRSYTLTFDQERARIVVDSYGEVLADETTAMTPEAWEGVSASFDVIRGLKVAEPAQGCTGGTGFAVNVNSDGTAVVDIEGYACGGVNSEASDQVKTWVSPVRSLFPPMSELAPEGSGEGPPEGSGE